ncbi:MAG TPA: anaerobic ribonucleoside-triphosphate reductase activating protein [archaeon]|nr:anaerobic ribonucleoside-triphosphate reductase activating protein [archaeon]HLD80669.1 anaerobic ribonucleoside-triphosphate reductase activating protein [archaeon]
MRFGGFQKTTLVDYPGRVASTVFTTGCNMRCGYCHNPSLVFGTAPAIEESTIMSELLARKKYIDSVVVTGGEPTVWRDLPGFLKKLKGHGFSVKLDTNGSNPDALREILEKKLVDYVAMDVKAPKSKYAQVTNSSLPAENIARSIALVKESGVDYEFRTTVAPGLGLEDLDGIALQIQPARKWFLQLFVSSKAVLDPRVLELPVLGEREILSVAERHSKSFTECGLRNA